MSAQIKIVPPQSMLPGRTWRSLAKEATMKRATPTKKNAIENKRSVNGSSVEKGLIITGSDAELLSNALSEVKTKAYEESEAQLDDTQALNALVSCFRSFRDSENDGQEKEGTFSHFNPFRKRLVLGTLLDKPVGADSRKSRSRQG